MSGIGADQLEDFSKHVDQRRQEHGRQCIVSSHTSAYQLAIAARCSVIVILRDTCEPQTPPPQAETQPQRCLRHLVNRLSGKVNR